MVLKTGISIHKCKWHAPLFVMIMYCMDEAWFSSRKKLFYISWWVEFIDWGFMQLVNKYSLKSMISKSKTCCFLMVISILHLCVFKESLCQRSEMSSDSRLCVQVKLNLPNLRTSHDKKSLLIGFFSSRKIQKERLSESILSTFKGKGPCTPLASSLSFSGYPRPSESGTQMN